MHFRLCVVLLAAASAGCVVGPDFRTPPQPGGAPAQDDDAIVRTQAFADAPHWWEPIGWPELDPLMRAALANNRDLATAQAHLAEAEAIVGVTRHASGPQAAVEAGVGHQKYGAQFLGPQDVPAFTYYSVTATASWFLDYAGGERRAVERDLARGEYRRRQLDAAYLAVTGNIVLQAFAIASAHSQLAAGEQILEKDARALELARKSFAAGEGTRMEVYNAQTQLARDRIALPPIRDDLERARHALAVLCGRSAASWSPPDFDLETAHLPDVADAIPSDWVRARPDILAAEAQLHAATASVGVATADLYPRIRISASIGPQGSSLDDLFDEDQLAGSLLGGLVMPIFDRGALEARRDAAHAAMQATLAQYEQAVLEAFAEVADLLAVIAQDGELIDAQVYGGEATYGRLAMAQENRKSGNAGVIPVIDAERAALVSRMGHKRAVGQRYQDTVRLMLALGGGLPSQPPVDLKTAAWGSAGK